MNRLGLLWLVFCLATFAAAIATHPSPLTLIGAPVVFFVGLAANVGFHRLSALRPDGGWGLVRIVVNGPLAAAAIVVTGGFDSPVWMCSYQSVMGSARESRRTSLVAALVVASCHLAAYALAGAHGVQWVTIGVRTAMLLSLGLFFRILLESEEDHRSAAEEAVRSAERARAARTETEGRFRLAEQSATHAKMASLGLLAASVAHEINNPINTIINSAQIILDGDADIAGGAPKFHQLIISEGERIARVVSNLLQFARGGGEDYGPVSLRRTLEKTLMLINYQLDKDSIRVDIDLPRDLPAVRGRMEELQQIFLNLVLNSRYALLDRRRTNAGLGASIGVSARSTMLDGEPAVVIKFRDNGTGIPSEVQQRIFDPFFTTKPKEEGTGLGLSVCHRIVKEHKGRIAVSSVPGEETVFTLTFPAITDRSLENDTGVNWTAVVQ